MTTRRMFDLLSVLPYLESDIKIATSFSAEGKPREAIDCLQTASRRLADLTRQIEEETREAWRLWNAAQGVM